MIANQHTETKTSDQYCTECEETTEHETIHQPGDPYRDNSYSKVVCLECGHSETF